jgi:hypothetical protein
VQKSTKSIPFYLALVHYPVVNRNGAVIASAITNLDLHDLARLACTYRIPQCFIVTPLKDQQVLAARLIAHWCEGAGRESHPDRWQALQHLRIVPEVGVAKREIQAVQGRDPEVWATSAGAGRAVLTHRAARRQLEASRALLAGPKLMLLGTAWGLAPGLIEAADQVLEAIQPDSLYNHLSVRCAAAILVDRLLGPERLG